MTQARWVVLSSLFVVARCFFGTMSLSSTELRYLVSNLIKENRTMKKANKKLLKERASLRRRVAQLEQQSDSESDDSDGDRASINAQEHPGGREVSVASDAAASVISSEDEEMPPALSSASPPTTTAPEEHPQLTNTTPTAFDAFASAPAALFEGAPKSLNIRPDGKSPPSRQRAKPPIVDTSSDEDSSPFTTPAQSASAREDDRSPPKKKFKPQQPSCPSQHASCRISYLRCGGSYCWCSVCATQVPEGSPYYLCKLPNRPRDVLTPYCVPCFNK